MLMTMSISRAPSRIARRVSKALTSDGAGAEGEADHRGDGDVRAAQVVRRAAHPGRVDADGGEAVLGGLVAELVDLGRRGVGLQERVVDVAGEVAGDIVGPARGTPRATRRPATMLAHLRGALGRAPAQARGAGVGAAPAGARRAPPSERLRSPGRRAPPG